MFIIHTPNGTKAVCLYAPSIVLAEESKQYVIPVEKVTEGEELCGDTTNKRRNQRVLDLQWEQKSR